MSWRKALSGKQEPRAYSGLGAIKGVERQVAAAYGNERLRQQVERIAAHASLAQAARRDRTVSNG